MKLAEIADRVKRHFAFNAGEIRALLITIILYGLIVSFSFQVEGTTLAWLKYLTQYLIPSILIVAISVLVHVSAIRLNCLRLGYKAEYQMNFFAIGISLILSILTAGKLFILIPGIITLYMLEGLRLGRFRYGIKFEDARWAIFTGPIANLTLALLFRIISNMGQFAGNPLLEKIILVNISIAIFSMLPLPTLIGFFILFSSRGVYAFTFALVIGASIALYVNLGILISIFIPLLIAAIGWIAWAFLIEKK